MKLKISILTPDGIVLQREDIDEIILPTSTGQIGILKNHAALVTGIEIGVLRIRIEDAWAPFLTFNGVTIVANNNVKILLPNIEEVPLITIEESEKQINIRRNEAKEAKTLKEKLIVQQNLKKALAIFQAVNFVNSTK
jgi:F-type H+-transporting ATPase subunit epsilon